MTAPFKAAGVASHLNTCCYKVWPWMLLLVCAETEAEYLHMVPQEPWDSSQHGGLVPRVNLLREGTGKKTNHLV